MNGMKETQKMMKQMMESWSETQQQMIDQWMEMVEERGGQQQASTIWKQTLSVWESSVKRTMEAQNATLNSWISQMKDIEGLPEEATEHVDEGRAIMKQWTEAQTRLWDKWFETMREMDPAKYESGWNDIMKRSMSAWRDYMDQMQSMTENMTSMAGGFDQDNDE